MRTLKIAMLATVATAALTSATLAADLYIDAPAVYSPAPSASYGLDGAYAGVYVLADTHTTSFGGGVGLGVNFVNDSFLLGIEGDASVTTAAEFYGQIVGKAGFVAGDSAAVYGLAGFGVDTHSGFYVPVGIGAEFMVSENLSLKAQGEYHWTGGGSDPLVGKVGLNFHF